MRVELTGGAYTARSLSAAAQRQLNLYTEPLPEAEGEPAKTMLYPTAGLRLLATLPQGPVRAIRAATNGSVYVVAGSGVYVLSSAWTPTLLGSITAGLTTPASMSDNGITLVIVDGSPFGWTVTLATNVFAPISDPTGAFVGADRVDYLDTFFVFNKSGTPQFYSSLSLSVTFDPLYFANKSAAPDLLVSIAVVKREIWLIGQRTTEVWYDAGDAAFPFEAMPGTFIDQGCCATYSVATIDNSVMWLSQDRAGRGIVLRGSGYTAATISTFAIEAAIAGYATITDAIGFCVQYDGHSFYVLTFPTADKTWCFDLKSGFWCELAWIDNNGTEHRHRGMTAASAAGLIALGDWQNGNLYALDPKVFNDNGQPIKRQRGFPHLNADGNRILYQQFIADMQAGALISEASANPAPTLLWGNGWTALPELTPAPYSSYATCLTPDGSVVAGYGDKLSNSTMQACLWTASAQTYLGAVPSGFSESRAWGISTNGGVISGALYANTSPSNLSAFTWTSAGGFVNLGDLHLQNLRTTPVVISGDGTVIAATRNTGVYQTGDTASRWTAGTGWQSLGSLAGYTSSYVTAISQDGSTIVGYAANPNAPFGSVSFRWTAGTGMVSLGHLAGHTDGQAVGVSANGAVICGNDGGYPYTPYVWTAAGGMVALPYVPDGTSTQQALGISPDGQWIVGSASGSASASFVWNAASGVVGIANYGLQAVAVPAGYNYVAVGQFYGSNLLAGVLASVPPAPSPTLAALMVNQVFLSWSDDRGISFGNPVGQSMGDPGLYNTSLQWQRLGLARDRVFRLTWAIDAPTALSGAFIDSTAAKS